MIGLFPVGPKEKFAAKFLVLRLDKHTIITVVLNTRGIEGQLKLEGPSLVSTYGFYRTKPRVVSLRFSRMTKISCEYTRVFQLLVVGFVIYCKLLGAK